MAQSSGEAQILSADGPVVLGRRMRAAREAQSIGVRALAKRVGVSASLISQVERGKVMPSVGTLYAVVRELEISMDDLFAGEDDQVQVEPEVEGPVLRSGRRKTIYLASGVRWERLTQQPDPDLDFQLATYDVGAESCPPDSLMTHGGREYGVVLSGRLEVTIAEKVYDLGPGDSISFSSTEPHRLANAGHEPAETVWLVTGREQDMRLIG